MREALTSLIGKKLPAPMEGMLEKLLQLDRLDDLYQDIQRTSDGRTFVDRFLGALNVTSEAAASDVALIPKQGPVIAVANHPFGLIEGALLFSVLSSVRADVKVLANQVLASIPETREYCIYVDPFGAGRALPANQRGLKDALQLLDRGGLLAVFPAGEVAHLDFKERSVTDPEWNPAIARIIRKTGASVLPVYFPGSNGAAFQFLGLLHPRLRTALLTHECLNKSNRAIELRIGNPIHAAKLKTYQDDVALIRYIRSRTYLLQDRASIPSAAKNPMTHISIPNFRRNVIEPLGDRVPVAFLQAEIGKLPPSRTLVDTEDFSVLVAKADEVPNVLHEIGRLREQAFRAAGEGSGKSHDIDSFDDHYHHLWLWNKEKCQIAGAYRVGPSEEILPRAGASGFYTNSLFHWKVPFLERVRPALELGRSFVSLEYQKTYAPLLLLWKGIGQFLVRNPQYKILFGPVSISREYAPVSQQLMVGYLNLHRQSRDLAPLVRARNPFRQRPSKLTQDMVSAASWDIEELSGLIADVEIGRKGIPVLLRQYLKLGAELVAFNIDRKFSNTLDGLIVVDLRKTDPRLLERYLGKDGAASFLNGSSCPSQKTLTS
jgi:putative hemolysin